MAYASVCGSQWEHAGEGWCGTIARHSARHRGHPARQNAKMPPGSQAGVAERGAPTPLTSCNSAQRREAASPHACAVGEAISGTEHTGSHLAVCRVRV